MTTSRTSDSPIFGYLSIVEDPFTAGLLAVCDRGRPLEFHCTEPVQPSRAQEILFGPTLRPYLLGEQLAGALLSKTKLPIALLLVDDADAANSERESVLLDASGQLVGPLSEQANALVDRLSDSIDPSEPFERVREAIREAQRMASPDTDSAEDDLTGGARAAA